MTLTAVTSSYIGNTNLENKRLVATRWLQTICFTNFFICKRKVSNFSCIKILLESSHSDVGKKIWVNYIITSHRIKHLSIKLRKTNVMPLPAKHPYHIANEIPVSNSKLLQLNLF